MSPERTSARAEGDHLTATAIDDEMHGVLNWVVSSSGRRARANIMQRASVDVLSGVVVGDVLAGKYRIERVVGVGGAGAVVAAHHLQLDEKVAIKFLLPEMLGNPELVRRFAREARAAARIKSEHVVRVRDVGALETGAPFMVMEYLEGADLAAWLWEKGPLQVEMAVAFILQACEALAEAHSLGIVHRDLKPANLFCIRGPDGEHIIKVLDFGISKATGNALITDGGSVTSPHTALGSPFYMAPEQMRSARDVDARADIWSLGVILYELLAGSGRVPFPGETLIDVACGAATRAPAPLRNVRLDVPLALEQVIARCLEKRRRDRFPDVGELARALVKFGSARAAASEQRIRRIFASDSAAPNAQAVPPSAQAPRSVQSVAQTSTLISQAPPAFRGSPPRRIVSAYTACKIGAAVAVMAMVTFAVQRIFTTVSDVDRRDAPAASRGGPVASAEPVADAHMTARSPGSEDLPPAPEWEPIGAATSPGRAVISKKPIPQHANQGSVRPDPPRPQAPSSRPSATVAHSTAPAIDCSVPYYFDAKGLRIFKKECL